VPEVVDFYGRLGSIGICITDHLADPGDWCECENHTITSAILTPGRKTAPVFSPAN